MELGTALRGKEPSSDGNFSGLSFPSVCDCNTVSLLSFRVAVLTCGATALFSGIAALHHPLRVRLVNELVQYNSHETKILGGLNSRNFTFHIELEENSTNYLRLNTQIIILYKRR